MKRLIFTSIIFLLMWGWGYISLSAKNASFYTGNSALSTGSWYKIRVSSDGVYKLTYDALKNMGISDPSKVEIRGYGGWMLDENFSSTYYDDLPSIAVWMNKGSDGVFNSGDYLLFYARGSMKWSRTSTEFVHTNNPYSDYGYYFVRQGTEEPLQMETINSKNNTTAEVNTYSDFIIHEKNEVNLIESGKEFYGESFTTTTSRDISIDIPGIVSWLGYAYNFVMKPASTVTLSFSLNGQTLSTRSVGANTNTYSAATTISQYVSGIASASRTNIFNFSVSQSGISNAYLNYLRIYFKRTLQAYGPVTFFRNDVGNDINKYQIANANSNMMVFDVTGNLTPSVQEVAYADGILSFGADASSQHEYALVDLSQTIPSPTNMGKIENQNLHALQSADMIIITPSIFKSYAEKLALAHYQESGLTCHVVDPNDIYNEFSSGNPDATAYRRFLKMFYDRGTSAADRPKYLLMFGGGTYNNKFINSTLSDIQKSCYLLTYQSDNSLSETSSYVTDDYFGFLSEEGSLNVASAKLCLGIGRLPARSTSDAQILLNKTLAYIQNGTPDIWKSNICFLADDAVAGKDYSPETEIQHVKQTDKYAEYVQANYPNFIVNKIYMDSYKRVVQANGNRYPDAHSDLLKKLNSGQLILNYVGHGSTRDWAHEYIMTLSDIENLSNKYLPLWITATCDFSRFDATALSGGEAALLNPNGGAIALLSTVRVVYISNNDSMSTNIYRNIFARDNGKALRFGDIIKRSKLSFTTSDENKVRFLLLGDPALRLSYPDDSLNVKISTINEVNVDSVSTVNLPALSTVQISGQIVDKNKNLASDFSGNLSSVVYDAQQNVVTLDNGGDGSFFNYKNYLNTLYSGTIPVDNGTFNIRFVVPKDIMYTNNHGKMAFFAWNGDGNEAQGSYLRYTVAGTDSDVVAETDGPEISAMYLNKADFVSGGTTNSTPMFHVEMNDASGINLSGGIGHTIELIVDGTNYYDLTSLFVASNGSSKAGYINFSIPELSEGRHSLKFVVWDVWNNYTEKSLDFVVVNDYKAKILSFSLAENPVKETARFLFSSNVPESTITVRYHVYSLSGALLWTHEETGSSTALENYQYDWNLITDSGARIRPGIYICKATISLDGKQESSKAVKLLVLPQ
ncbi:MAG: type IX secretion system sortase PorU [Dysgonamonadaceae bacterium]